ncbi:MAG TPA: hypothetical protein V6C57_00250 [Coleofasciculaceae cyanobacterium]
MMIFPIEELLSLVAEPEGDEARTLVRDFRTLMHFNQVTAAHVRELYHALGHWSHNAWLSRQWNRSILCSKLRLKLVNIFVPKHLTENWLDFEILPDNAPLHQSDQTANFEGVNHDINCTCCDALSENN